MDSLTILASQFCRDVISLGFPFLSILPNYSRFMQCLRRYRDDTKKFHPHIINAGKYLSTILATFFQYIDIRIVGNSKQYSEWNWARTVWIILNLYSSTYKLLYDILVDWVRS